MLKFINKILIKEAYKKGLRDAKESYGADLDEAWEAGRASGKRAVLYEFIESLKNSKETNGAKLEVVQKHADLFVDDQTKIRS